ncbi:hypothetical protein [Acaryochloris sp. IP29b_bin.148]|nr:hypothetical protein [Acaryochloris sp. IP29b_bin.148]
MISLIQAGLGICVMPHWQGIPRIVYVPVADLDFQRTIGVRWRQSQT